MEKQQPASLSGRIGGQESVRRLVEIFYDSVGQEPEEHPYADTRRRSDVPKKARSYCDRYARMRRA